MAAKNLAVVSLDLDILTLVWYVKYELSGADEMVLS